jgi:prepilin peptidase CpaA
LSSLDIALFVLVGACGITDIQTGKIYNKVTYPAILLGVAWNAWAGGSAGFVNSLQGFLLAAVVMGGLVVLGGMGGGDAKLLAAIGSIKGYPFILDVLFYSFLVGGAMALCVAIWQGRLWRILARVGRLLYGLLLFRRLDRAEWDEAKSYRIPFGVAICLGALWAQGLQLFLRGANA